MCRLAASTRRRYAAFMKKDTSVNVRLTSELRAELQRLADGDGRKLSAYIERVLQLHVKDQPEPQADAASKKKRT